MQTYNIDPNFIPEQSESTFDFSGDWDTPTPLTVDRDPIYGTIHAIICVFGSWHVSIGGDLFCVGVKGKPKWYPIMSEQLLGAKIEDWILHLMHKGWFDDKCYEDFKRAYFVACKIAGAPHTAQIRTTSGV